MTPYCQEVFMDNLFFFKIRLKELRNSNQLTQPALAEIIGLKKQTINDIEKGRSKPSINSAIAIANHFNVSLDYLFGRTDNPEINK